MRRERKVSGNRFSKGSCQSSVWSVKIREVGGGLEAIPDDDSHRPIVAPARDGSHAIYRHRLSHLGPDWPAPIALITTNLHILNNVTVEKISVIFLSPSHSKGLYSLSHIVITSKINDAMFQCCSSRHRSPSSYPTVSDKKQ